MSDRWPSFHGQELLGRSALGVLLLFCRHDQDEESWAREQGVLRCPGAGACPASQARTWLTLGVTSCEPRGGPQGSPPWSHLSPAVVHSNLHWGPVAQDSYAQEQAITSQEHPRDQARRTLLCLGCKISCKLYHPAKKNHCSKVWQEAPGMTLRLLYNFQHKRSLD